jgi:hypothetical protein
MFLACVSHAEPQGWCCLPGVKLLTLVSDVFRSCWRDKIFRVPPMLCLQREESMHYTHGSLQINGFAKRLYTSRKISWGNTKLEYIYMVQCISLNVVQCTRATQQIDQNLPHIYQHTEHERYERTPRARSRSIQMKASFRVAYYSSTCVTINCNKKTRTYLQPYTV